MITEKQERFIETYLQSKTISETIRKLGISRKTAYSYLDNKEIQTIIRDRKMEILKDTTLYMENNLKQASEQLIQIINDKKTPQSVKVQAINSLFSNYQRLFENIEVETQIDGIKEQLEQIPDKYRKLSNVS